MSNSNQNTLTPAVLWIMAISSGLIVANNYYNQPLLSLIANDLHISAASAGKIAMMTQVGYAAGLFTIVPLGDLVRRKRLIMIQFAFILLSLIGMAMSRSIWQLYTFSFLIGLTSVIPQLLVPMAASLSTPEKRTQSIGFVMSGLLIGILGSRVLSGIVGELYGWRTMFYIAAVIILVLWGMIAWKLPEVYPEYKGTYLKLMKSVVYYARTEPVLQAASFRGAFAFAAFSAFWTSLVYHLEQPPFFAGSSVAGSFGVIGMAGALAAALVGRIAKIVPYFRLTLYLILAFIASWLIFYGIGNTYIGLILGVIVMDAAMQALHIMNQSSIFTLHPEANNRLNTVYMTSYFVGGALGTYLTAIAWQQWLWNGVLMVGFGFSFLTLAVHFLYKRKSAGLKTA
ncbi:MFS transporter [Pedobacter sp. BAL39]|uniref:MFS transporter n=1 Tax=Pedobacter sp. BAL39 TaxID=391596 RepID=UPI000586730D|nr:MFS transporter [Pedobacter sp. BAL39]